MTFAIAILKIFNLSTGQKSSYMWNGGQIYTSISLLRKRPILARMISKEVVLNFSMLFHRKKVFICHFQIFVIFKKR